MTDNRFDNKGSGDQNIAQGKGAVGKQDNSTSVKQTSIGDSNISTGTGNVTVNQDLRVTPRITVLTICLLQKVRMHQRRVAALRQLWPGVM